MIITYLKKKSYSYFNNKFISCYFYILELRVTLEQEKKKLENLQKQLEEADYAQAQLSKYE